MVVVVVSFNPPILYRQRGSNLSPKIPPPHPCTLLSMNATKDHQRTYRRRSRLEERTCQVCGLSPATHGLVGVRITHVQQCTAEGGQ